MYSASVERLDNAMRGPTSVAVTPDGLHVYVAAEESRSISAFKRNKKSGLLIYLPESSLEIPTPMGVVKSLVSADTAQNTTCFSNVSLGCTWLDIAPPFAFFNSRSA